jgi:hypothetical protein
MNKKYLIGISIHPISLVEAKTWEKSFIRVNIHPDYHVEVKEWLQCIDFQVAVGERFFKSETSGMFKAMPALW